MPIPLGIFATAGAGGAGGSAFELISTQVLTSSASSVTFSSIPATYKHLQLRMVARNDASSYSEPVELVINTDTGANYAWHFLQGNGSTVSSGNNTSQSNIRLGNLTSALMTTNAFSSYVIDILDYASTSKNTTVRALGGHDNTNAGNNQIRLASGLWMNTASVTTLRFQTYTNFISGTRMSLYGIKG